MNRLKLLEVLEILKNGLEKNKEIPIYEYVCFTGKIAFSSNLLFTICAPFKTPKPFAVNGFTLISLLQASQVEEVTFKIEGTDLVMQAGNSEFELPIKEEDEFIWKEPILANPVELDTVVSGSIRHALNTCSENQALEGYARICIKTSNGLVHLYSTDGDALTRYNTGLKTETPIEFCLGRDFCEMIHKIVPVSNIKVTDEWVCAESSQYKVYGQNLGAPTIDYETEIDTLLGSDSTPTVPVSIALDNALNRAIVVASVETSPTKVLIEKGEMTLVTETPFGNVYDTLKTEHSDVSVKINAELLQKQIEDTVFIKFIKSCIVVTNDKMLRLIANMG